ncbi:hypothetical protein HPB52_009573 [Rhipicephalus sanguineus]|uniref:CCHC-type domain-containing protein n=1 Tax=Rhipicephalus sanguineus TaxID=34632 RepID=A0A9D4Q064_RHISA|nr:hypothetical protein HPB52_009573 [Rhipicephalus sanguineus]
MPATIVVEGMDINPQELNEAVWTTALGEGGNNQRNTPAGSRTAISPAKSFMKQITAAFRLPTLPKDQIKIIVRPKGGLNVSKADIIHLAQALAMAAALTEQQTGEDTVCPNKVSAYIAAPDGTCKGVIRNIDPSLDDGSLKRMIVSPRNPKALEVRRIKNTHVVVILFDGMRVPNTVMCGAALVPCFLYKRQVDVCYECGHVGHRADVCASSAEEKNKGHGCGKAKSSESEEGVHQCTPKFEACGGPHITGDRTCRHRYHIPYIARRRRRRRRQFLHASALELEGALLLQATARLTETWEHQRIENAKRATWADTVKGSGGESSTGKKSATAKKTRGEAQSEQVNDPRIQSLEAENQQLRRELAELKEALNSIREQFSHHDEGKLQALGPLAGKPKRKAPYPETVSETDNEDEMAESSEDTATAAAPPARSKGIGRLASIEKTLGRMMAMLSGMETRLTQLERPKVQAISRLTSSTVPKQANPNPDGGAKGQLDNLQKRFVATKFLSRGTAQLRTEEERAEESLS